MQSAKSKKQKNNHENTKGQKGEIFRVYDSPQRLREHRVTFFCSIGRSTVACPSKTGRYGGQVVHGTCGAAGGARFSLEERAGCEKLSINNRHT